MQPILIKSYFVLGIASWINGFNVSGLSLGPFIIIGDNPSERLIRHESIHFHQQIELLFILQWILYGLFYLVGLIQYLDSTKAYYNNPFEREAYANEHDLYYLDNRPFWAWVRFIQGENV